MSKNTKLQHSQVIETDVLRNQDQEVFRMRKEVHEVIDLLNDGQLEFVGRELAMYRQMMISTSALYLRSCLQDRVEQLDASQLTVIITRLKTRYPISFAAIDGRGNKGA